MTKNQRIAALEAEVTQLRELVQQLLIDVSNLKATQQPLRPWWPNDPWIDPHQPFGPIKYESRCSVCGIDQSGVMGYVCSRPDCPTAVTCGTNVNDGTDCSINKNDV